MSKKLETEIVINLAGNLANKARQYGNSMSDFAKRSEKAMTLFRTSAAAASRGIDTFGNRTLLGLGAGAVAFERTFIKTAAEFERYQVMLNKLQGSEAEGAKALDWIERFTQETPFGINEVMNSFIRLKAFGLDPMDGSLQAIADQAAMMGGTAETIDGISLALGQAWTKGKLQGEEALQLLERGVPVWDYLIKASKELGHNNGIGYTASQLQDMASKGLLTRDAIKSLIKEMGNASSGSAKKQMETWNGMISNMGDTWTIFKKDVMDSGAFRVLRNELGEFLDQLEEMKKTGEYDKLVDKVGKNLVDSFKAASEAAIGIRDVGRDLLPILKAVGSGASAIASAVGGYENLAKILLSVYALNKALKVGAPLLKGAIGLGSAIGRKGHQGGFGSISDMGVMPVFVVNMPGGMGSAGLPDLREKSVNPKSRTSKFFNRQTIASLGTLGLGIDAVIDDPSLLPINIRRKETVSPDALGGLPIAPGLLDVIDDVKKWLSVDNIKPISSPEDVRNMVNSVNGQLKLKLDLSDNRPRLTIEKAPPGITVDPDMGFN